MNLFPLRTSVEVVPAQSLDELWCEAERLGCVDVDHSILDRSSYRVRIKFDRASGTTVWAEGRDKNISFALSAAINEARLMGAGAAP